MEQDEEIAKWTIGRIHPTPSQIPDGWDLVNLTGVARLETGHTPDKDKEEYWKGDIPWVSLHDTKNLDGLRISETEQTVSSLGLSNSSARLLPEGTVVFSRTATVGKATILEREMATSQDFANYICGEDLNNEYLAHLFRFMKPEWERLMAGSTHSTIYMDVFRNLQILLPPLEEQERIAEVLTEVDEQISSLNSLIEKKSGVRAAMMHRLLSGAERLPDFDGEWEVKTLGEIGTFSKGSGIRRNELVEDGVPCVRYGELYTHHDNKVKEFASFVPRQIAEQAKRLKQGDLLFTASGETKKEIGMCAAYLKNREAYAGGDLIVLRPESECSEFLGYALNGVEAVNQKASMAQGDAVVHIRPRDLAELTVSLPPLDEQQAIADVLSDMDEEIAALEKHRDKTKAVKKGMMQELLTGKTRLLEEPASAPLPS